MKKQVKQSGATHLYRKNDEFEIRIIDMTSEGEGIGKTDAFPWFIKDCVIGDKVKASVTKVNKSYGYARVLEITEPSKDRITPDCEIAKRCGGCNLQAMSYKAELDFKSAKVFHNLVRIGGFDPEEIKPIYEPIIGADEIFRYRNKAQYPIGYDKDGRLIAGFYAGRSHQIIETKDCLIGAKENADILKRVLTYMQEAKVSAYHEEAHTGVVRHVLIRKGFFSGELMVTIVVNAKKLPNANLLVDKLRDISGLVGISYNMNTEKTNVILGKETVTIHGKGFVEDTIGDIRFKISPNSFFQVNPHQTYKLYSKVLEWANLTGEEVIWDLYCGIGSISLFLANHAKNVYGIEIVEQAILDARENARINGITNAKFFVGRAEEILPKVYDGEFLVEEDLRSNENVSAGGQNLAEGLDGGVAGMREGLKESYEKIIHPDVIVVDPPRKGCDRACLETILKMEPERLVYVSCDSATLARDLKILCDGGYQMEKVVAVDQFPRTVHVETVVLLSHKKPDGHINVKVEFGEGEGKVPLDNIAKRAEEYKPKERVTYKMIKEYIEAKYGFKVHTAYIAEVKRDLGLPMYDAPNAVEELKQPRKHPTAEKVEAIKDALKYFGVCS